MYERYCKIRDRLGYKDAQVAKATGIGKSTFSDWKSGRSVPKRDKLQKIAEFFGVSVDYLMGVQTNVQQMELSAEEMQLLRNFRKLNAEGRARAIEVLDDMAQLSKWREESSGGSSRSA